MQTLLLATLPGLLRSTLLVFLVLPVTAALSSLELPPHQATLFGPGARRRLPRYASGFRLSGDLDYFLQLSRSSDLVVQCSDLELVHMSAGGISGQQTKRRLQEVRRAYYRAFGLSWWISFLLRYVRRIMSLMERND